MKAIQPNSLHIFLSDIIEINLFLFFSYFITIF